MTIAFACLHRPAPAVVGVLLAWLVLVPPPTIGAAPCLAGADFSHLAFFESRGILYRENGQTNDALRLLKQHGLTCVRLRLFTSSAAQAQANPYNYINNLDYTLPLAVRVKQAGLQLMLDFHYSDTWADPGHQAKPAAWTNLAFDQLVQQIRQYSSNSIAQLKAAGAMPEYVQIGNEITGGMLWPDGQVGGTYDTPAQWAKLGQLMTNAIRGVLEASGTQPPKLIVHIDRGGDWSGTQWFFDHLLQQQVQFDIIGESYYPFWHGSLDALRQCLTNSAQKYGKPVMVAETAFPWANSTNILGIAATPAGQVQFLSALAQVVTGVPGGKGQGILWWGAEYQSLSGVGLAGFDRRSFFDGSGNVLPIADAFGRLADPFALSAQPSAGTVTLTWPLSGAGAALVAATNPVAPAWRPVTNPVQNTGAYFRTSLPINTTSSQFYRLQSN